MDPGSSCRTHEVSADAWDPGDMVEEESFTLDVGNYDRSYLPTSRVRGSSQNMVSGLHLRVQCNQLTSVFKKGILFDKSPKGK